MEYNLFFLFQQLSWLSRTGCFPKFGKSYNTPKIGYWSYHFVVQYLNLNKIGQGGGKKNKNCQHSINL